MAYVALTIIFVALLILTFYMYINSTCKTEGYRDPIYLNRQKLAYDWYPRANGSIYGYPIKYGGSWNLFSGFPYYPKAY